MNKKSIIVGIIIGILATITAGSVWLCYKLSEQTSVNTADIAQIATEVSQIVNFINSQTSASQKSTP